MRCSLRLAEVLIRRGHGASRSGRTFVSAGFRVPDEIVRLAEPAADSEPDIHDVSSVYSGYCAIGIGIRQSPFLYDGTAGGTVSPAASGCASDGYASDSEVGIVRVVADVGWPGATAIGQVFCYEKGRSGTFWPGDAFWSNDEIPTLSQRESLLASEKVQAGQGVCVGCDAAHRYYGSLSQTGVRESRNGYAPPRRPAA